MKKSSSNLNDIIKKKQSINTLTANNLYSNINQEEIKECKCKKILVVDDNNFNIMAV